LSAAERAKSARERPRSDSSAAALQTSIPSDSGALIDISPAQFQTNVPSSIEDILKASPLKNPKAECATPISATLTVPDVGTQCPTDLPTKK
jgi:hypothetical protein